MRNKLYRHEEDIRRIAQNEEIAPPDFVWKNIETELSKPRRKPFLPFLLGGILMLLAGGSLYYFNTTDTLTFAETKSASLNNPVESSPLSSNTFNNSNKSLIINSKQQENEFSSSKTSNNTQVVASSSSSLKSTSNFNQHTNKVNIITETLTENKEMSNHSTFFNQKESITTAPTVAIFENKTEIQKPSEASSEPLTEVTKNEHTDAASSKHYSIIDEIPILPTAEFVESGIKASLNVSAWKVKRKTPFSIFIEPYIGYGMNTKSLTVNSALDSSQNTSIYTNKRKETEKTIDYRQAGLLAGVQYRNFSLRTGIQYQQLNDLFEMTINNWVNESGQVGLRHIKWTNSYYLLDIPILAGYEKRFGRFNFQLIGGTVFNIRLKHNNGFLINSELVPDRVSNHENFGGSPFLDKLGAGVLIQAGIEYQVNNNFAIFTRPTYRSFLKNWSNTNQLSNTNYSQFGINAGVKIGLRRF